MTNSGTGSGGGSGGLSGNAASLDASARAELVQLVLWLQTFPGFSLDSRKPVTSDTVMDLLSTSFVAREIWKVADDVYGAQQQYRDALNSQKADDLWTGLLVLTSTRARPLRANKDDGSGSSSTSGLSSSPPRLKAFVLSSLLDSAVQSDDYGKRNEYIQRIMGLPKETQRLLMSLIERRGIIKGGGSGGGGNGGGSGKSPTPTKSSMKKSSSRSSSNAGTATTTTRNSSPSTTTRTSPSPGVSTSSSSASRMAHSTAKIYGGSNNSHSAPTSTPPPPPPPLPGSSKDTAARHRGHGQQASDNKPPASNYSKPPMSTPPPSSSSSSAVAATPPRRPPSSSASAERSSSRAVEFSTPPDTNAAGAAAFLSPATMESPGRLQYLVSDLKQRNDHLQAALDQHQQKQEQLLSRIGTMEIKHRQDLLHQETLALERLQSAQDDFRHRTALLQEELEAARQEASDNASAAQELRGVRDQLDEMQHQSQVMNDLMEKLRRYKTKVEELHDVQQKYEREQEAHASCVQEVIRLESQVAALEPYKRQVEDYKSRAVQAEFQLGEANERLRKLEIENKNQCAENSYLWQGAIQQKEQLKELAMRLQQEESSNGNGSLEASTSERINPELQGELERLRSENAQLRRFYDERQGDAVIKLQQDLDGTKSLGEKYKEHYLSTKASLAQVQSELVQLQQLFRSTTDELTARAEAAEATGTTLREQLQVHLNDLDATRAKLQLANDQIRKLEEQVLEQQINLRDAEKTSSDRLEGWKQAQKEVDDTNAELDTVTKQCQRLLRDLEDQKVRNKALEELQNRMRQEVQSVQEELEEAHMQITDQTRRLKASEGTISQLTDAKAKLQEQLEKEKQAHDESREEADRSLQASRTVLLAQSRKQVDEVQENMNRLLEDERRANRRKDEEHKREVSDLNTKWKKELDEVKELSALKLQQSRHEAVERIESLKQEYQHALDKSQSEYNQMKDRFSRDLQRLELEAKEKTERECEKIRLDGEEAQSNLIKRGKAMIEDAHMKAESDRRHMEQLVVDLESRLKSSEKERAEIENLLRSKIAGLKDKLESASEYNADLIRETEELQEKIKAAEREYVKLKEDNDRYRRHLGSGGFAGGQVQAQLERLQREYNAVVQENRNLKKVRELDSLDEAEDSGSMYGRGRSTISQVRREYEERIESLTDEKRELVMKNSAAITDVQKAEQRAWEREQEVSRLKNELTSLKLDLARIETRRDGTENASPHPQHDMSFMTAEQDMNYSPFLSDHGAGSTTANRNGMGSFDDMDMPMSRSRSPSLNRAMKNRAEHEQLLRSRITSLTGTPPRAPSRSIGTNGSSAFGLPSLDTNSSSSHPPGSNEQVLSPTKRHENIFNTRTDPSYASPDKRNSDAYASDHFGLRRGASPSPSMRATFGAMPSLLDERSTTTYETTVAIEPARQIEDEDAPAGIVGAEFFGGNKQKQEFYDPEAEMRATDNFREPEATFDRFNSDAFPTDASRRIGLEVTAHIQSILYNSQPPFSSVYASNLQWTTPLQFESKAAAKSPLEALRTATQFYRKVDVAITACRPTSSEQFEMHWEIGLTWPIFWAPRVLLCMKSSVTLNDQEQIVSQVDELMGGKDLLSLVTSQVLPRFWDVYHIGMTPSAEVSPLFPVGSKGILPSSYQVHDLPPRWYWQPSLYDVGSREDSNAAVLPNHGFVTAIRTMGPQKDEYVPTSPVEVQLLPVSSSTRLRLRWSIPVAVSTLASNARLTIPSASDADGDQRNVEEEQPACEYVWQGRRRVATVPFRGRPQDSSVSAVRKALYEQVVKDGWKPKLDRETKRPVFFFWQNTVKACYAQQGLGMAVYESRPSFTKPNRVGVELEL